MYTLKWDRNSFYSFEFPFTEYKKQSKLTWGFEDASRALQSPLMEEGLAKEYGLRKARYKWLERHRLEN